MKAKIIGPVRYNIDDSRESHFLSGSTVWGKISLFGTEMYHSHLEPESTLQ
jgi:hypothetical protein